MSAREDNLKLYGEYAKTLRTWIVGFGFGVPALFIVNEAAQKSRCPPKTLNSSYGCFLPAQHSKSLWLY